MILYWYLIDNSMIELNWSICSHYPIECWYNAITIDDNVFFTNMNSISSSFYTF